MGHYRRRTTLSGSPDVSATVLQNGEVRDLNPALRSAPCVAVLVGAGVTYEDG
jgi:hypothetical protein